MSSSRVVRVHAGDQVGSQTLRDGIAKIQAELEVSAAFASEVEEAASEPPLRPVARPRPHRPALRDHRPAVVDGPRPGPPPRTRGKRVRRPLRDRRRRRLRRARRSGRPGSEPARRDPLRRRLQGPAPSDGALRGRRLAPARPGPAALLWTIHVDDTGEGTDVQVERAQVGPPRSSTTRACSRRSTTAAPVRPCSCSRSSASSGSRARPDAGHLAAPARTGGRHRGRRMVAALPLPDPGGELERPDLAPHRLRGRVPHGLRPGRAAPHPAAT